MSKSIYIRFYEELNDFLPHAKRKKEFEHRYFGNHTIKDIIESIGVPHVETDLILANGKSVSFNYKPDNNERISVYPVFESLDIKPVTHLRPKPLRNTKFIADVHLGKLAKYLRLVGFDTYYENDLDDDVIVDISLKDKRVVLTRDIGILKNGMLTHGLWIRNQKPKNQLREVINRLNLHNNINPFSRCMNCNGLIEKVNKKDIRYKLKPNTDKHFNNFYRCTKCSKVYWRGSHYEKMINFIEEFKVQESK